MDWVNVWLALMHGDQHYRPEEITGLSMAELSLALEHPEPGQPLPPWGSRPFKFPGDREAYLRWWRGLSMRDRLDLERDRV